MNIQKKIIKKSSVKKSEQKMETTEIKKLFFLILIIVGVFFIFYGITCLLINKDNTSDTETPKAEIQYDEIIASKLLEQNQKHYYVLLTLEDDDNMQIYNLYKEKYEKLEKHDKIYTVNLDNPFNKSFVGDKTNTKIKSINELKLKGSTLIYIVDSKISKYYEGEDIIKQLKSMAG